MVTYNKKHEDIVKKGIDAIEKVLKGSNVAEKESLLFCLDKYLDPWFGYDLPRKKEILELVQYVVIDSNSQGVKEGALQLLTDYSWPPFTILENNLDKIEPILIGEVQYAINMDNNTK